MSDGRYGLDRYGLSPYGGVVPIAIIECYPVGPRTIYIRFNTEPLTASPVSVGDCQNRQTWDLTRDDTKERIEVIGAVRLQLPEERKLLLLTSLAGSAVRHTLDGKRLRTSGGLPAGANSMASFRGVDVDRQAFGPASRKPLVVDLRNDNLFGEGVAIRSVSGGDYAEQVGASGLRKRLIRMISTKLGTDPSDPGFGCLLQLGELIRDPAGQKALILAQVLRDPEVQAATVGLEVRDEGVAYITVKAKMTSGGQNIASIAVGSDGVKLG